MYPGYIWGVGRRALKGSSRLRPKNERPAGIPSPAHQNGEWDVNASSPPVADKGTKIVADEAASWDGLHARYEVDRINHHEAYSLNGVCSNGAESFFSRPRRGEIGHHHHVAGPYLIRYAQESAWRENNRRVSNGDQTQWTVALALASRPSVDFRGYWQRHKAA
jgi:hypothetical protein